ncbi:PLD nuclease N-terminal domain-containing protein [Altererythrobacter lauratis]|uniref:PLD nuclease N-terminal domain-containing protein n=1 Tax=Alteraurantiacibacter lauratis TaxID=2054627 RepID=A0ABV7EDS1_9SPHN
MEIFGLIGLLLALYAIYNVLTSGATTGAKIGWTIGLVLLPILGFIVWLIAGPRGGKRVIA